MDMPTKIICTYGIYIDNKAIPVNETKNGQQKPEILINKTLYPNGELGDEVIVFTEHTKVEIMLVSDDPAAEMEVESYNAEGMKIVKPGESIVLSPGEEKDNMLVPGYCSIIVRTSNFIYRGTYKVIPSSIGWEALLNIRKYLEEIANGLSYNIYAERNGHNCSISIKHNTFLFELYKYIEENYDRLFVSIDTIIGKPITDICKKYDIRHYSRRPDKKSQRWLSEKGQMYNDNPYVMSVFYEKHSELTYNTPENQIIKKILDAIYDILIQLYKNYLDINNKLNDRIQEIEKQNFEAENHLNSIKLLKNIKKAKLDIESKIYGLQKEKEEYIKESEVIKAQLKNINKMKNLMSHYKNETWLNDIDDCTNIFKPTIRLIRDKCYSEVYEIYRKLYNMKEDGKKDNAFPHKSTSKLFEIYNFILIKDILEDLGFQWTNGWLKKEEDILSCNKDLLSSETIILFKDDYKIELDYDKEISKTNSAKKTNISQLVSTNSKSRRPDITLKLYKAEKFIGSFIAEIKCRKKQYIYNKNEDTDVMYQLIDYSSLKYYDGEQGKILKESGINKIIVIYPKQEGVCKFNDKVYDFSFIQVEPTNLSEKPYGYEEIKEEIQEFLLAYGV